MRNNRGGAHPNLEMIAGKTDESTASVKVNGHRVLMQTTKDALGLSSGRTRADCDRCSSKRKRPRLAGRSQLRCPVFDVQCLSKGHHQCRNLIARQATRKMHTR